MHAAEARLPQARRVPGGRGSGSSVTDPGNVLLDRAQLERAFTALGDRLVRRGVVADVFIVGGAAMALAYDATRVTRDVDSLFVPHGVVLEEARNVAQELGLPPWWLNEHRQTRLRISGKGRPWQAPRVRPPWPACYRGFTAAHLRDEGACGKDPRHRRPALAGRDDRRGLSRNRSSDMCRVLPRRGHPSEVCRCPPRALRLTCECPNHPARRPVQEQADAGQQGAGQLQRVVEPLRLGPVIFLVEPSCPGPPAPRGPRRCTRGSGRRGSPRHRRTSS